MIYNTEKELMGKANEATGKTFREIDKFGRLDKSTKGQLGHIIEESLFGYNINSTAGADFADLNIELKVTPVKLNKNNTVSAKERLVLNIINYMTEPYLEFENSNFWKKNQKLLIMFYLWLPEKSKENYPILKNILYTFPEEDLEIIKNDWKKIIGKIKIGKAHELSEGDTLYLGACTKGANKSSLREQPASDIKAMQRAFSLKGSYMTSLVRKELNHEELASFATAKQLKEKTLEELLEDKFVPFVGKSLIEIANSLEVIINPENKGAIPNVISALLGIKGTHLNKIEEFSKANIQFKTIRLEPNGVPKEHMSFENIDLQEWLNNDWKDNIMYKCFEKTKFLFVVFEYKDEYEKGKKRTLYFKGIKLWNMPLKTIETDVKSVWEEVTKVLTEGVKLELVKWGKGVKQKNNFPGSTYNQTVHIRSKGRDGQDKVSLPDRQMITKQCYWLDRRYVAEIVKR